MLVDDLQDCPRRDDEEMFNVPRCSGSHTSPFQDKTCTAESAWITHTVRLFFCWDAKKSINLARPRNWGCAAFQEFLWKWIEQTNMKGKKHFLCTITHAIKWTIMPCGFYNSKSSESMTISQDQTSPRPAIFIKVTGGPAARSAWLMLTDALWYPRTLPVLLPWDPQCHHHQCQTSWRFLISPCPWQRWPERFTRFLVILQSLDEHFETQYKHGSWHHGRIGSVVKQKGWPRTLAWSHHWRTWHVQSFLKHSCWTLAFFPLTTTPE